ncbi:uncharacterized protein SPPG_05840 [Spizellomyces punctatus DAOM BR117]|uniref:Uncharacterized protein n=1 Tax=Spizellomyces punctatus (strain DAOM BR117) TaxID=645134 RepID=A0A0L0HDM7_SPIPD|nr:uncharacterized protein SPPG_05840 [Spizellomyces punctatus DAOM BR117]KNC98873.1 hypothetical protein SPPG_05840 [Spizellomyces punctatus DAOM BR117]|eukprot:XP_016606913.1 hypothetical protein SPPG_05840 [Spizellomyces punctatus DAOM BR117]
MDDSKSASSFPPSANAPIDIKINPVSINGEQEIVRQQQDSLQSLDTSGAGRFGYLRLFKYSTATDYFLILIGTLSGLAAGPPLPILGIVFGELINEFAEIKEGEPLSPEASTNFKNTVNLKLRILLGVTIAFFLFTYICSVCWSMIGERITRKLREEYLKTTLGQDIAYFDTTTPGEVTNRMTADIQTIQNGTSEKVGLYLQSIAYLISAFAVGFAKNARLTAILLCVVPAFTLVVTLCTNFIEKYAIRASDCQSNAGSLAEEMFSNIRVVQAFNSQNRLAGAYTGYLDIGKKWGVKKAVAGAVMLGGIFFVAYCGNALAFWQGAEMIVRDSVEGAGTVYTVIFLVLDSSLVVGEFAPFIQTFSFAAAAGSRLFSAIDRTPAIDSSPNAGTPVTDCLGEMELKSVKFVYPSRPDVTVLDGVSMKIPPGKITAIVGASGSGKSTIVSLLQRFYDPVNGTVLLDHQPLPRLNVHSVRRHMGVVMQTPTLFQASILDNIGHGLINTPFANASAEFKEKMCLEAAKIANVDEFIKGLPQGYQTIVGEGGAGLSGGQKQRIAIARAVVGNPRILLLDEATSALDSRSERLVQQALDRVSKQRTTVVVAHRLATVKNADNIMVMSNGKIVEQGTHNELMRRQGAYYDLVQAQSFSASGLNDDGDLSINKILHTFEASASTDEITVVKEPDETDCKILEVDKEANQPGLGNKIGRIGTSKLMRRVARMSSPETKWIIIGLLASVIIGSASSVEAVLFANLVDSLSLDGDPDHVLSRAKFYSALFLVFGVAQFVAYFVSGAAFGWVSETMVHRVRAKVIRNLLRQDIEFFESAETSPSTITATLDSDGNHFSGLTGVVIGTVCSISTNMIISVVLALVVSWKIAIVILTAVPVMLCAGYLRVKIVEDFYELHQTAYVRSSAIASEAVGAIQTVAALGREADVLRQYRSLLREAYAGCLRTIMKGNFWLAFAYTVSYLLYGLAYWWGSRLVSQGEATSKQLFVVLPALLFSAQTCGQMFSLAPDITKAKLAAVNIFRILDMRPKIDTESDTSNSLYNEVAGAGSVELNDVRFSYPTNPDTEVLKGLSLRVEAGSFCALVGGSGCGKSTVLGLIERFYDPSSGTILVDSKAISTLPIRSHRHRIALVNQEPALYQGSIAFNILLGTDRDDATQDDVIRVCKDVGMHDFIMSLPDGYDTDCGGKGARLSGGQRQRIAIARALIRDPQILLLDEATSALDSENEKLVQDALSKACIGRTTIAIAHRLSTVQHADQIFVLEEGQVAEQGTHAELMTIKGKYWAMVEQQTIDMRGTS